MENDFHFDPTQWANISWDAAQDAAFWVVVVAGIASFVLSLVWPKGTRVIALLLVALVAWAHAVAVFPSVENYWLAVLSAVLLGLIFWQLALLFFGAVVAANAKKGGGGH